MTTVQEAWRMAKYKAQNQDRIGKECHESPPQHCAPSSDAYADRLCNALAQCLEESHARFGVESSTPAPPPGSGRNGQKKGKSR